MIRTLVGCVDRKIYNSTVFDEDMGLLERLRRLCLENIFNLTTIEEKFDNASATDFTIKFFANYNIPHPDFFESSMTQETSMFDALISADCLSNEREAFIMQ